MRTLMHALPALALLAACGSSPRPAPGKTDLTAAPPLPVAERSRETPATFACDDSLTIYALFGSDSAGQGRVALAINDQRLHLPQLVAASGARYGDSTAIFWNKGDSATLDWQGKARKCGVVKATP
jgi:membrane-bound inhibitor of C-type lysozyme